MAKRAKKTPTATQVTAISAREPDPADIPPFLRLSQEQRTQAWADFVPPPAAVREVAVPKRGEVPERFLRDPGTRKLLAELEAAKEVKRAAREVVREEKKRERQAARTYLPKKRRTGSAAALFAGGERIVLLTKKNPKKEGTPAGVRFALLMQYDKRTFAEFLAAGGNPTTLKNAIAQKRARTEK